MNRLGKKFKFCASFILTLILDLQILNNGTSQLLTSLKDLIFVLLLLFLTGKLDS